MGGGTGLAGSSVFERELVAVEPALRRFAAVLVGHHDREDLVQDTFARALAKRALFDPERGSIASWTLSIMLNLARGRWRGRRADFALQDSVYWEGLPEVALDVRAAVDRLPARQRASAVLFYFVDLPVVDVARSLAVQAGR